MIDSSNLSIDVSYLRDKLSKIIDDLALRQESGLTDQQEKLLNGFREFYEELSEVKFTPDPLIEGDVVSSDKYNKNLRNIFDDINRFYTLVRELADSQIVSYNYAQIVSQEIINKADSLASTVLDLNILNNFTRGDVIVAGDDFNTLDYVDLDGGVATFQSEVIYGTAGMGLARRGSNSLANQDIDIQILPLAPRSDKSDGVQTAPTIHNLQRFYEGNYYNFLGQARPEGGNFNFQYLLDPSKVNGDVTIANTPFNFNSSVLGDVSQNSDPGSQPVQGTQGNISNDVLDELFEAPAEPISPDNGYVVEVGATAEAKTDVRLNMVDSNPNTFWECEYIYRANSPLLGDLFEQIQVIDDESEVPTNGNQNSNLEFGNPSAPEGASLTIDLNQAEQAARQLDFQGRDLIVDIIITLPTPTNVNLVAINPVIFGSQAFMTVLDIATSEEQNGVFRTVDGWNQIRFARTITTEANEVLTDSQLGATLAPSRTAFRGQGVYPFPPRVARKIKIRIAMPDPVAQPYERVVTLLERTVEIEGTVTTTTKKGLLA